jgi:hypothetical protein
MKKLSINWELVTVLELQVLLSERRGYLDGDKKTVELIL